MRSEDRSELAALDEAKGVEWIEPDSTHAMTGVRCITMRGSKTAGEFAFLLPGGVLITGDLVRAHRAGSLMLLPDPKLKDKAAAVASVAKLAELPIEAVLVGDGQSIFRDGQKRLQELVS